MDLQVSFEAHGSVRVVKVSGELTAATEAEFTARVTRARSALSPRPPQFDLSGLHFVDRAGARSLALALPGATVLGCSPSIRRVLDALGHDLPDGPPAVDAEPASPVPEPELDEKSTFSRGAALTALAQATRSSSRRSANHASEVMSRLAATYAALALNSQYRTRSRSEKRGRLLELSGQARDLSERYRRHAGTP